MSEFLCYFSVEYCFFVNKFYPWELIKYALKFVYILWGVVMAVYHKNKRQTVSNWAIFVEVSRVVGWGDTEFHWRIMGGGGDTYFAKGLWEFVKWLWENPNFIRNSRSFFAEPVAYLKYFLLNFKRIYYFLSFYRCI